MRAETKKLAKQSCASLARKPTLTAGVKGQAVGGIWEPFRKSKRHVTMKNSMNHLEIAGAALFIGNYFGFLEGSFRQLHGNSSDDVE